MELGEADRLLAACGSQLRAIVEAALETGCRKGELLSLQWHQVRSEPRQELVLPESKTKTKQDRRIPATRLAAILAMRRTDPEGVDHPPNAYVFGNEIGQRVRSFKRACQAAVLRAHGYAPQRVAKSETRPDGTERKVFAIELASRRVQILGSTPHPDEMLMCRIVRNLALANAEGVPS